MGDRVPNAADTASFREFRRTRQSDLRDALVEEHLGLAKQVARRFTRRGEPFDDLYQVACIALVKAVDRFDVDRQIKFSTFAVACIVGDLKKHFRDRGWHVKAPRRLQELYLVIGAEVESLTHNLGRAPTVSEIAEAVGTPIEAVLEAMEAGRGYQATSLEDATVGEAATADHSPHEDLMSLVETREILHDALRHLPPREQELIRLRFVDEMTQSEIARHLGLSQMHVSRLLSQSVARLRAVLGDITR